VEITITDSWAWVGELIAEERAAKASQEDSKGLGSGMQRCIASGRI